MMAGELRIVPKPLGSWELYKLVKITAATQYPEIRAAACKILEQELAPVPFIVADDKAA